MNLLFQHLFQKLQQPKCLILGLMSGTSADGLNLALCEFQNTKDFKILHFANVAYSDEFRDKILNIRSQDSVNLEALCRLNVEISREHARIIQEQFKQWGVQSSDILAIASHGQTVYHAPAQDFNSTLQLGDADHLAVQTGCLVWSDFRQKHVAVGGEGAPLAIYADAAWYHSTFENRVLLNLGGIANFTWLPAQGTNEIFATDTGPANTLLDMYCRKYFHIPFDLDGELAKKGTLHTAFLDGLMQHSFFLKAIPKSTGQELFNENYVEQVLASFSNLSPHDILNTLVHFTAKTIATALATLPKADFVIYGSGGGMLNSYLLQCIQEYTHKKVYDTAVLGIQPDAKEAALFALLAYEAMFSKPFLLGHLKPFYMGKLSFPI